MAHSRRVFLFKLSLALNAAVGAVLAVPLVGYLLGPIGRKSQPAGSWISLGPADRFAVGEITLTDFQSPVTSLGDGETGKVACWVRRVANQEFQVFAGAQATQMLQLPAGSWNLSIQYFSPFDLTLTAPGFSQR